MTQWPGTTDTQVFYVRARAMAVIPTFQPLPSEGVVRLLLSKVGRLLKQSRRPRPGRGSRVWTLAERMARHGRHEQLNHWLSLEAWLGMVVDAMLRSTDDRSASQVYRKILGQDAGQLLDSIMGPLALAIDTASMLVVEGLEDKVAELFCTAVGVWHSANALDEAPTKAWLHSYLLEADLGVYQAWSEPDRVWAVYVEFRGIAPGEHLGLLCTARMSVRAAPFAERRALTKLSHKTHG
ncbi:hypothetical protein TSOC_003683 [Tetrabaena socialis]|uniref:Uncharacterized protein n=1 Tax=Tetrabaena socialis TaxID=47790 RepID=A0A2J8AB03_9CHLO|nr:hypothetical protein TSOC_003683 [Tetrabaena socialis]|eukprot:PNH09709.1 hypothetical protein TSOC_003683 [Tetrabaena socialis]